MPSEPVVRDAHAPKVLFLMADYGHDPTETAVPFMAFYNAGWHIEFATENGKQPVCDKKMLEGITQKLLGANQNALHAHKKMLSLAPIQSPLSWSSPSFSLSPYNLLFFPGGHDKGVRQIIDSALVHKHIASYFPLTLRDPALASATATATSSTHNIAAVCHGVMVLSQSTYPDDPPAASAGATAAATTSTGAEPGRKLLGEKAGKSVLWDVETTALPARFEQAAYQGTRLFLGDYYKTYGAGSEDVQESVTKRLRSKEQWKGGAGLAPFVHEDPKYRYISARWPGDAQLLAEKVIQMVTGGMSKEGAKA